jgi:hypothetical protein
MISDKALEGCLGRLTMLRYFPSNLHALRAIAGMFSEFCQTDSEAAELTKEIVTGSDVWIGPQSFSKAAGAIADKRRRALEGIGQRERQRLNKLARDRHEGSCTGYGVDIDESAKTVDVYFCGERFGDNFRDCVFCRKGGSLRDSDPGFCGRLAALELAGRAGWSFLYGRFREGRNAAA